MSLRQEARRRAGREAVASSSTTGRGILGFQLYDLLITPPACDCSCCATAPRRTAEVDGGSVVTKCSAPQKRVLPTAIQEQCGGRGLSDRSVCSVINDPVFMG